MPSRHTRSKEDTWTTDELSKALKSDEKRRHRDRDEDRKRDRINGEERHRRRKDEDSDRRHHDDDDRRRRHKDDDRRSKRDEEKDERSRPALTEDERERQRQERRERREKKDGSTKDRKEIQFRGKGNDKVQPVDVEVDNEEEERQRRRRDDRDRRHRDDDDREKRRRHRDENEMDDEEEERERRRRERRERKEEEERKKRPEKDKRRDEDRDRRRDKDDRSEKHRDRDREKRSRDDRDGRDRSHKDRDRDREKEREERRREKEERQREEERLKKQKEKEEKKPRKKSLRRKSSKKEEEGDDYGDYEEDFEDYEEDFEEDEEEEEVQDTELNDVLKALDEENEKLIVSQSRSPQMSGYDYGRDSHYSRDDDEDGYRQRAERPKTAINFVSAKQRAVSRKTANKTAQRGRDLLQMLELDFVSFDILDLPPVKEYDLYIRAFGRSDTRQAYIQTNDDNIDRDIQTDEIDYRSKWTQYPAEDSKGYGRGDGEKDLKDEESQIKQTTLEKEQDTARLNKFLEKASEVMAIILEEGRDEMNEDKGRSQAHINVSEGYTELDVLPILQDRYVEYAHFSPTQPNLLLTVYSKASTVTAENPVSKRGIICVWNTNDPSSPQKFLACSSQPKCCCFSPVKPSLVFAGMVDGSVAMWDLRETSSIHKATEVEDQEYSLRYPTYDTAGILDNENHHSPVVSIVPIYSYIESGIVPQYLETESSKSSSQAIDDSSSGMSFQLVSTEEAAVLHFWVVAEIPQPDIAGTQNDLGLAPGGCVKLLKSSSLVLESPTNFQTIKGAKIRNRYNQVPYLTQDTNGKVTNSQDSHMRSGLRALDMNILPSDPNQFYVSTDSGFVVHGVRFGTRTYPRAHSPVIESIVDVTSIDFSPFNQPCFLAGCSDGSFSLYHTKSENPLVSWSTITRGRPIQCIRWSRSRPCVFYVLDDSSNLYVFNIIEGDCVPKHIEQISKHRVICLSMTNDQKASGLGTPGKEPQILFGLDSGKTEIHTVTQALREPEQLELEYLNNYLSRF